MPERKFQFTSARTSEEQIEAIYEELSGTPTFFQKKPPETLKEHIVASYRHGKHLESQAEFAKEREKYANRSALMILALLASVFVWLGVTDPGDFGWVRKNQFSLQLWGIALSFVFVGVSIERSSLFSRLWSYGFTKVVVSLAISALFVFCAGKASSLINSVFGVDASVFPYTRAFIGGLLAFQYAYPLLIVVAAFAVLHAIGLAGFLQSKLSKDGQENYDPFPWESIAFLVLALVVLGVFSKWVYKDFSDDAYPTKVYRLAHLLDFNTKHQCLNIKQGVSVVFLGHDHLRVLVDTSTVQTENIQSFVDEALSQRVRIPSSFFFLDCQTGLRQEAKP